MDAWDFFQATGKPAVEAFVNRYRRKDQSYAWIQWYSPIWDEELKIWLYMCYSLKSEEQGHQEYQNEYVPFKWRKDE